MSTSLIATQEPALFDEEGGSMLGNADVLSWQRYTDLMQCNFANLRGALRGPSLLLKVAHEGVINGALNVIFGSLHGHHDVRLESGYFTSVIEYYNRWDDNDLVLLL